MSLPLYSATRTDGRAEVFVTIDGDRQPLPYLQRVSKDGFDWGYTGPGPFDLARSIVGHYLVTSEPADNFAKAIHLHLIHPAPEAGWTITPSHIHDALRNAPPIHGPALHLGRVGITRAVDVQLATDMTGKTFIQLCLLRHELGDWGDLCTDGLAANQAALRNGGRLLSRYPIPSSVAPDAIKDANEIWIITEARDDSGTRASTTVFYQFES